MFVDVFLTAPEEGVALAGVYDECRAMTLVDGEPVVSQAVWRTGTETRVGGEPSDPDVWASTSTVTKLDQESDDRD
jgi:hypothetical protein